MPEPGKTQEESPSSEEARRVFYEALAVVRPEIESQKEEEQEAPASSLSPKHALSIIARSNKWLSERLLEGTECTCNRCLICAHQKLGQLITRWENGTVYDA